MQPIIDWATAHWQLVLIVVVYGLVNLAPRPHPEKQTGAMRILWLLLDRVSVMTAERVPGRFKMLLAASPHEEGKTESPVTDPPPAEEP